MTTKKKKGVVTETVTMKATPKALDNFRSAAGNSGKKMWEIILEGSQFVAGKYQSKKSK